MSKNMLPRLIRLKEAQIKRTTRIALLKSMSNKSDHLKEKLKQHVRILAEYEESIKNLETYGWEKSPNGKPVSVDIGVPSGRS